MRAQHLRSKHNLVFSLYILSKSQQQLWPQITCKSYFKRIKKELTKTLKTEVARRKTEVIQLMSTHLLGMLKVKTQGGNNEKTEKRSSVRARGAGARRVRGGLSESAMSPCWPQLLPGCAQPPHRSPSLFTFP